MDTCNETNEILAFGMEVYSRYIPGICKNLEYVRHIPDICMTYDTIRIPDVTLQTDCYNEVCELSLKLSPYRFDSTEISRSSFMSCRFAFEIDINIF